MESVDEDPKQASERLAISLLLERIRKAIDGLEQMGSRELRPPNEYLSLLADLGQLQLDSWAQLAAEDRMEASASAISLEARLTKHRAQFAGGEGHLLDMAFRGKVDELIAAIYERWSPDVLESEAPIHTYYEFEDEVLGQLDRMGYALAECDRLGIPLPRATLARLREFRSQSQERIGELAKRLLEEDQLSTPDWSWTPTTFWWRR